MIVLVAVASACVCGVVGFWLRGLCPFASSWARPFASSWVGGCVGGGAALGIQGFAVGALLGCCFFQVACLVKVRIHQWFV